jgi:hypothetical protein
MYGCRELSAVSRQPSAVSSGRRKTPSDIAEGCCRRQGDFARFLQIALGAAPVLEFQLLVARDLLTADG